MKLHPAEIAKELKTFHFFRSFPDDLLLQVSTMVDTGSFSKGQTILSEGQENHNLYFLRNGHAEVVLAGEVVALLQNPGEVIGEMSVVTKKPVSTTIRAAVNLDVFVINTENFDHVPPREKDHFLHLLFRIYSNILADRLVKTNEKARLFEIANRELHQAQVALDGTGDKSVLLVESDRKQLALAKVALGSTGVRLDTANEVEAAKALLAENAYDAVLADESCVELLEHAAQTGYPAKLVLMTTKDVAANLAILKRMSQIDTVVTRDTEDRQFTIRSLLTTLTKILSGDLFGIEKYLAWGVDVQAKTVKTSSDRERLREDMTAYFKKRGVRTTILERVSSVTEELLMNAIYDAPTDSRGNAIYNHLSRKEEVVLEAHHQSTLRYSSDGMFLAVSVSDPFGSLTKGTIVSYLESCFNGNDNSDHTGKGGAGKGLHQIVQNSDLTIFNIKKGVKSEVVSLFYLESHKQEPQPSFHYFFN